MLRLNRNNIIALVAGGLLAACSGVPSEVIQPDTMAKIMADMHVGEAVLEQNRSDFASDSSRQRLKMSIFSRYDVNQELFDSSMMWYGRHIEKYSEVYDLTTAELEKRIAEANRSAAADVTTNFVASFQAEGDSVDIWPGIRQRNFATNMPSDRITFNIKSDRYWEPGDIYTLRYKVTGNSLNLNTTLAADYPDGEILYVTAESRTEGWHETTLVLDPLKSPTVVYGSIAAPAISDKATTPGLPLMVDSISLVRMRKDAPNIQRRRQYKFHYI